MKIKFIMFGLIIILLLFVVGCSNNADKTTGAVIANGEVKEFDVIAKNWEFQPSIITVNEGDTVILRVKSIDVEHSLAIPEFGVNQVLSPGKIAEVKFVADQKGNFEMFCAVYCGTGHREMKGTLI